MGTRTGFAGGRWGRGIARVRPVDARRARARTGSAGRRAAWPGLAGAGAPPLGHGAQPAPHATVTRTVGGIATLRPRAAGRRSRISPTGAPRGARSAADAPLPLRPLARQHAHGRTSSAGSKGFARKASTPTASAALHLVLGTGADDGDGDVRVRGSARSRAAVRSPSSRGMTTSRVTTSGRT